MEEKGESQQEEKPVLPPNTDKLLQRPSQIQDGTTSHNSPRTTTDSGPLAPISTQQSDTGLISTLTLPKKISSLRRKRSSSSAAGLLALCKKLKIHISGNEDLTVPPAPGSLLKATLQSLENRISSSESLKRTNSSTGLTEDLVPAFKVMKMKEPNLLDDSLSPNEQFSTPSEVSVPTEKVSPLTPISSPSCSSSEHVTSLAYPSTPDGDQDIRQVGQGDERLMISTRLTPTSCIPGPSRPRFDLNSARDNQLEKQRKVEEQSPSSSCSSQQTDEPKASSRIEEDDKDIFQLLREAPTYAIRFLRLYFEKLEQLSTGYTEIVDLLQAVEDARDNLGEESSYSESEFSDDSESTGESD